MLKAARDFGKELHTTWLDLQTTAQYKRVRRFGPWTLLVASVLLVAGIPGHFGSVLVPYWVTGSTASATPSMFSHVFAPCRRALVPLGNMELKASDHYSKDIHDALACYAARAPNLVCIAPVLFGVRPGKNVAAIYVPPGGNSANTVFFLNISRSDVIFGPRAEHGKTIDLGKWPVFVGTQPTSTLLPQYVSISARGERIRKEYGDAAACLWLAFNAHTLVA